MAKPNISKQIAAAGTVSEKLRKAVYKGADGPLIDDAAVDMLEVIRTAQGAADDFDQRRALVALATMVCETVPDDDADALHALQSFLDVCKADRERPEEAPGYPKTKVAILRYMAKKQRPAIVVAEPLNTLAEEMLAKGARPDSITRGELDAMALRLKLTTAADPKRGDVVRNLRRDAEACGVKVCGKI